MLDIVTASAILFPEIYLFYELRFWKQFLKNLVVYSIIAFLFPSNGKPQYPLIYFIVPDSTEYRIISIY